MSAVFVLQIQLYNNRDFQLVGRNPGQENKIKRNDNNFALGVPMQLLIKVYQCFLLIIKHNNVFFLMGLDGN